MIKLPTGTFAMSVTAHITLESGDVVGGSGVSLPYPVGDGVTESERIDCVL